MTLIDELAASYQEGLRLADVLAESEDKDEIQDVQQRLLDEVFALEYGVDQLHATLKGLKSKAEMYRGLAHSFSEKARNTERTKDLIEEQLMDAVTDKKLVGTSVSISICKNSVPSLLLTEEEEASLLVRPEFTRSKVELDKKVIIEAIKDGSLDIGLLMTSYHVRLSK